MNITSIYKNYQISVSSTAVRVQSETIQINQATLFLQNICDQELAIFLQEKKRNEDWKSESKNTRGEVTTSILQKYGLLFAVAPFEPNEIQSKWC